ncbi:hypothetical protein GGD70_007010 [Paraburkholderia fungorum]|nr:hypothetical protein [Paraburkholderia fungorum]
MPSDKKPWKPTLPPPVTCPEKTECKFYQALKSGEKCPVQGCGRRRTL